jgi:type II secretory pathway component PulF
MPTFEWTGLDLAGDTHKGRIVSSSIPALRNILAAQKIALLYQRAHIKNSLSAHGKTQTLSHFSLTYMSYLRRGYFCPMHLLWYELMNNLTVKS